VYPPLPEAPVYMQFDVATAPVTAVAEHDTAGIPQPVPPAAVDVAEEFPPDDVLLLAVLVLPPPFVEVLLLLWVLVSLPPVLVP
jgi:hypothetical protein